MVILFSISQTATSVIVHSPIPINSKGQTFPFATIIPIYLGNPQTAQETNECCDCQHKNIPANVVGRHIAPLFSANIQNHLECLQFRIHQFQVMKLCQW
jgi:hypothetical protein